MISLPFIARLTRIAVIACVALSASPALPSHAQDSKTAGKALALRLEDMAGTWKVSSRMWPAADAQPIDLPPAIARRELLEGAFLQEIMEPAENADGPAFTRVAYVTYNSVYRQYEYFSLDTRLPQMMTYVIPGANKAQGNKVDLLGRTFVAPAWGAEKNVPFSYRIVIGAVEADRQLVQLFLTKLDGAGTEFLAFEYVYTR